MNALESDYRQLLQLAARRRDRREHALTLFQRDVVQLQTGLLERQKLRFVRDLDLTIISECRTYRRSAACSVAFSSPWIERSVCLRHSTLSR